MTYEEEAKKEEVKKRMEALRAKRKPPKLANVHPSILELSDDDTLSYANVKKWIATQEGIAKSAGLVERSRNREIPQKERDKAMRERMGAQAYIRSIKRYIATGDWSAMYYGEYEQHLTKWVTVAAAENHINS